MLVGFGCPLESTGQFTDHTEVRGEAYDFRIVVVKSDMANLLRRSVVNRMRLIVKVEEFEEVSEDIGRLTTESVKVLNYMQ